MEGSLKRADCLTIDASIAVWALIPALASFDTLKLIRQWRSRGVRLIAPGLFLPESTSAIRKLVHSEVFSEEEGATLLSDLFDLAIDIVPETAEHCRAAFRWAARLGQSKAYDGFYLAVAEEHNAKLWTADKRLVDISRENGINWVHWAGESDVESTT
jgi:predicted nucleic acid-binding protein